VVSLNIQTFSELIVCAKSSLEDDSWGDMKNLKIGTRLGVGFTFMLGLTLLMTMFAFVKFSTVSEHVGFIAKNNIPKMEALFEATLSVQNVTRSIGLLIAIQDPGFRDKERAYIEQERATYRTAMQKYESLGIMTGKGQELFDRLKDSIHTSAAASNKALEFAMAGNQPEAERALAAAIPLMKEISQKASELMAFQNERVEQRSAIALSALDSTKIGLGGVCLISILAAAAGGILITKSITAPLHKLCDMLKDIAQGEGDLTKRLDDGSKDELGEVSRWFNLFVEKLHGIISQLSQATHQVASASSQLHSSSEQIATGAEEVAVQAGTVATASEEMSCTSNDIARNCGMAAEASRETADAAHSGAAVVQKTITGMNIIAERVKKTSETVVALGSRSEQIGNIVGTIEDIADQTNLLALNAAIEAARAGEQGRGFAVVADEVRALAERTTRATREIGEMIKAIQNETNEAVKAMDEGVIEVEKGALLSQESGQALEDILTRINEVSNQIIQIATAAEEQTATTNEVTMNVQQITEVVAQTSRGADETAGAASQLKRQAQQMEDLVGHFKLA
jgi:methyl-accepting chemotaxis protein